ncbi:DNA methyltransferase [Phascolarctobacterium faecium]|uniref:DNA methyltransferase n=1 Tax=Phascolarctobacterium faecium TaxID=33025 RepID=UPI00258A18AB|nr:DNA methyltransferase [uncultured Phascolarctobacterium sp.]
MPTIKSAALTLYNESDKFLDIYPEYDLSKLPRWVQDNIKEARVYGNQKKGVILPDGRKYHLDNKLNDMTGRDWTFFINSVFTTHYPTRGAEGYAHEIRKIHPSPKPPQLMRDLISFFTKEGELVFDAFVGVGGSLLGAALCNRKAAGIDLNQEYLNAYTEAARKLNLQVYPTTCGDCIQVLQNDILMGDLTGSQDISLCLIDPPYANMMSKKKTGADVNVYGDIATPFTNESVDLGNMKRLDFLETLKKSVELMLARMKPEGYVVVFIKDLQPQKKETNLLHAEVVDKLNEIPKLYYKGMKIWADESAKIYPYGYPFSFVANQIHQYILVFRKEKR